MKIPFTTFLIIMFIIILSSSLFKMVILNKEKRQNEAIKNKQKVIIPLNKE